MPRNPFPEPDPKPRKRGPRRDGPTPIIPRKPKNPNMKKKPSATTPTPPAGGRKSKPKGRMPMMPKPKGRVKPAPMPRIKGPNGSVKPAPMPMYVVGPDGKLTRFKPEGGLKRPRPFKPGSGSGTNKIPRPLKPNGRGPAAVPAVGGTGRDKIIAEWKKRRLPKKPSLKKPYGMGIIPVGGRRRGI